MKRHEKNLYNHNAPKNGSLYPSADGRVWHYVFNVFQVGMYLESMTCTGFSGWLYRTLPWFVFCSKRVVYLEQETQCRWSIKEQFLPGLLPRSRLPDRFACPLFSFFFLPWGTPAQTQQTDCSRTDMDQIKATCVSVFNVLYSVQCTHTHTLTIYWKITSPVHFWIINY